MAVLQRKFYQTLLKWKNAKSQKCLLVKGARQVGKTFILQQFGREQYSSCIYLNFLANPKLKEIFADSLEAPNIYRQISTHVDNIRFLEHDTLIILDEIQECPQARTALKFLALDDRYDVVASGSLLGLHYREITSIPVGYEQMAEMYALDFEEFLWAVGKNPTAIQVLYDYFNKREKVPDSVHATFMELVYAYLVVGGMPEAVKTFHQTNNYQEVAAVQKAILASYRSDIDRYASTNDRQKINDCYQSIPRQLAKEYTKFQYKIAHPKGSARYYNSSIQWLIDAGLTQKCVNVSLPILPLLAYELPSHFKLYLTDIGLLTNLCGWSTQKALLENTIYGPAKGGIYENLIFDMLLKRGCELHYFKDENSTQEIEFLYAKDGYVIPIEVKSKNGPTKSLNTFLKKYKPPVAYKFTAGNLGIIENKVTIPFYMAMFI